MPASRWSPVTEPGMPVSKSLLFLCRSSASSGSDQPPDQPRCCPIRYTFPSPSSPVCRCRPELTGTCLAGPRENGLHQDGVGGGDHERIYLLGEEVLDYGYLLVHGQFPGWGLHEHRGVLSLASRPRALLGRHPELLVQGLGHVSPPSSPPSGKKAPTGHRRPWRPGWSRRGRIAPASYSSVSPGSFPGSSELSSSSPAGSSAPPTIIDTRRSWFSWLGSASPTTLP